MGVTVGGGVSVGGRVATGSPAVGVAPAGIVFPGVGDPQALSSRLSKTRTVNSMLVLLYDTPIV
jgi:hypothetical protein